MNLKNFMGKARLLWDAGFGPEAYLCAKPSCAAACLALAPLALAASLCADIFFCACAAAMLGFAQANPEACQNGQAPALAGCAFCALALFGKLTWLASPQKSSAGDGCNFGMRFAKQCSVPALLRSFALVSLSMSPCLGAGNLALPIFLLAAADSRSAAVAKAWLLRACDLAAWIALRQPPQERILQCSGLGRIGLFETFEISQQAHKIPDAERPRAFFDALPDGALERFFLRHGNGCALALFASPAGRGALRCMGFFERPELSVPAQSLCEHMLGLAGEALAAARPAGCAELASVAREIGSASFARSGSSPSGALWAILAALDSASPPGSPRLDWPSPGSWADAALQNSPFSRGFAFACERLIPSMPGLALERFCRGLAPSMAQECAAALAQADKNACAEACGRIPAAPAQAPAKAKARAL